MTNQNGDAAAAVAEPEVTPEEAQAPDEQAEGGLVPEAAAEGEPAPETPAAVAEDVEPVVDVGKSLAELRGVEPPAEGETETQQKPGFSLTELEQQEQQQYERTRNGLLGYGEPEIVSALEAEGLEGAAAKRLWEQKVRPMLQLLDSANDKRRYTVINEQVKDALKDDPAAAEAYFGRAYGTIPEAVAGGVAAGRDAAAAEFKAKVDKGDYLTPKEAQKLIENDRLSQKKFWEGKGINFGTASGNTPNGGNAGGRHFANEDALHTAFNNGEITREVYGREYKRITSKDL